MMYIIVIFKKPEELKQEPFQVYVLKKQKGQ